MTAEIIWKGKEEPLVFLDSLKEAHLYFLEGMKNEDAKRIYQKEYTTWREDPSNFCVDGVYPLQKLWGRVHDAWEEILLTPVFVINIGGSYVFKFNKEGEAMNMTAHMYTDHIYHY